MCILNLFNYFSLLIQIKTVIGYDPVSFLISLSQKLIEMYGN